MSEKYFDGKNREFYELKLGQLTIDEFINKFLELMRYVPYIKDEKVKMKWFISGMPRSFRDKIEFDEPNTLEDIIRKARYCYEQFKNKTELHEDSKKKKIQDSRRRGLNPLYLRTMGKVIRWAFLLKVYIRKIFHLRVEINPLE